MNAEKAYKDWIESRLDRGLIMPFFPVEIFIAGFEEAKKKMDAYVMRDEKLATAMQIIEMQKEGINFYANARSWVRAESLDTVVQISIEDCDEVRGYSYYCGGKRAREIKTKTNELIKKLK